MKLSSVFSIVFVIILVNNIEWTSSINSGVKMQVSQKGLDYAAGVASMILKKNILNKTLRGIQGNTGELKYEVENVKITDFIQAFSGAQLVESTNITWSLLIASLKITADWNYNLNLGILKLKDRGSLNLETKNLSLVVTLKFGYNSETGTATIETIDCTSSVHDIDLRFTGRNRNLYTTLFGLFKDGIKQTIEEELCQTARKEIDENGNEELSTLEVDVRLDRDLYFDYRLTQHPEIKDGYLETSHVGIAFGGSFAREPLENAQPEMNVRPENEMVSFLISEDSLQSYGRIFISKNTQTLITRDDMSDENYDFLDADSDNVYKFVEMMPSIAQEYPNASFEIDLKSDTGLPKLKITPSGLHSNVSGKIVIYLRLSNGSRINLATARMNVLFNITARIEGHTLKLKLLEIIPFLTLEELNRQLNQNEITARGFNYAIQMLSRAMKNRINKDIKDGVPVIKTSAVEWENTRIVFYDRFLRLSADLKYSNV